MIGSFEKKQKDCTGTWETRKIIVLSAAAPRNVRGRTSEGNWAVDYETPSSLGKTGQKTNTEYFWRKKEAEAWIQEITNDPKSN